MTEKRLKFYQMDECDTVIAYSKREAIVWYSNEVGIDINQLEVDRITNLKSGMWWSISGKDLIEKILKMPHNRYLRVGSWAGDVAYWVTFEKILDDPELLKKVDIPSVIRTTEY